MNISDSDFHRFVEGDGKAFEIIFKAYYKTLVSYSMRHGLELMEAEDIVLEVFHRIWQIREELKSPSALHTLLYTSVRNRSLNVYRNLRNRQHLIEENFRYEEYVEEPHDYVAEEEMGRLLDEAVEKLPGQCKVVITSLLQGKSMQEIADGLDLSVNTVKTNKQRGIEMLKDLLSDTSFFVLMVLLRICR